MRILAIITASACLLAFTERNAAAEQPRAHRGAAHAGNDAAAEAVRPGQKLHVVTELGTVRVERDVEALQTARPGQRLFVRSADGQVFSIRYEEQAAQ